MEKTVIIYGSSTGTTKNIAEKIAAALNISNENIFDVAKITPEIVSQYDFLILGTSTWGAGDLQDDWYNGIEVLKKSNLSGKKIALFGCGDSSSFSDTFCGALGLIYQDLKSSGAVFIGQVCTSDYSFDSSDAVVDGQFIGLAIDEDNEPDKTDDRIARWVQSLK